MLGLTPERIRSCEKARKELEMRDKESVNTVVSKQSVHLFIKHMPSFVLFQTSIMN